MKFEVTPHADYFILSGRLLAKTFPRDQWAEFKEELLNTPMMGSEARPLLARYFRGQDRAIDGMSNDDIIDLVNAVLAAGG